MTNTCIIILVLAGIALVVDVVICLYSLYLMKKYQHRYYKEGYTALKGAKPATPAGTQNAPLLGSRKTEKW